MKITVRSRQKTIDEAYIINNYEGSLDTKVDRHFIRYTERLEEDSTQKKSSGSKNNEPEMIVKTMIKVSGKEVQVTRSGALNSQLIFIEGETVSSVYPTPMGDFDAEITTKKVRVKNEDEQFVLKIFYDLTLNGSFISECEFELVAKDT